MKKIFQTIVFLAVVVLAILAYGNLRARWEVQERLAALGVERSVAGPDEVAAILRSDIEKWGAVIKDAGIAQLD